MKEFLHKSQISLLTLQGYYDCYRHVLISDQKSGLRKTDVVGSQQSQQETLSILPSLLGASKASLVTDRDVGLSLDAQSSLSRGQQFHTDGSQVPGTGQADPSAHQLKTRLVWSMEDLASLHG